MSGTRSGNSVDDCVKMEAGPSDKLIRRSWVALVRQFWGMVGVQTRL